MFKTLISTFLLCGTLSNGAIHQRDNYSFNDSTLSGCYCLKDEYLFDLAEYSLGTYTFFDYNNNDLEVLVDMYDNTADKLYCTHVRDLYINVENNGLRLHVYDGEYSFDSVFLTGKTLNEYAVWWHYFEVYFAEPYTVTGDYAKVFHTLFTPNGNEYNSNYSGYYTIFSSALYGADSFQVNGNVVVNNVLMSSFAYNGNGSAFGTGLSGTNSYVYNDYTVVGDNRVLLSVMIPEPYYYAMDDIGVFEFVQDTTQYEFKDLMISIADVPISFLRELFSFELFGLNLYVAFASVLTLVLIAVCIRKFI